MKKFVLWIVVFVLLLTAVPVLITVKWVLVAKVVGIVLIMTVAVALRIWLHDANKNKVSPGTIKFTINDRFSMSDLSPLYKEASKKQQREIERRLGRLVSELDFDSFDGAECRKEDCLALGLALMFITWDKEVCSMQNKIIVFSHQAEPELRADQEKQILFINPEQVKSVLFETRNINKMHVDGSDILRILKIFYSKL